MTNVIIAFAAFGVLGLLLGLMLAFVSKIFAVKTNPKVEEIAECLPGANCGGCGYASCHALAEDIVNCEACEEDCLIRLRDTLNKS